MINRQVRKLVAHVLLLAFGLESTALAQVSVPLAVRAAVPARKIVSPPPVRASTAAAPQAPAGTHDTSTTDGGDTFTAEAVPATSDLGTWSSEGGSGDWVVSPDGTSVVETLGDEASFL